MPDQLLHDMDELHRHGKAAAGSQQLAELVAEFGLQHDEYEQRQKDAEAEAERKSQQQHRAQPPAWRRAPHR